MVNTQELFATSRHEGNLLTVTFNLNKQVASGRASGSESRRPGFDPHRRHRVVSMGKTQ